MHKKTIIQFRSRTITFIMIWGFVWGGFIGSMTFDGGIISSNVNAVTIIVDSGGGGDQTTIQAGINAASTDDTVFVRAGTYNENVQVNKKIQLIGDGAGNTTINGGGSGDVVTISVDGVTISGFLITNSGSSSVGLYVSSSDNCEIYNINVSNNYWGMQLISSSNNIIRNNMGYNNQHSGIVMTTDSNSNLITNNSGIKNKYYGIQIASSTRNIVSFNTCAYNERGIEVIVASYNIIKNNTSYKNSRASFGAGIMIFASSNNTVENNTCINNFDTGIYLYSGSYDNKVKNNNCSSNNVRGISLTSSPSNNIIEENIITNNSWGMYVTTSTRNNIIINNTINFNTVYGILISNDGNRIENNTISNSQYGLSLGTMANGIVKDNLITDNSIDGIRWFDYPRGKNYLLNNLLINNPIGINFTRDAEDSFVINTTIINSTGSDIRMDRDSDPVFINCSLNYSNVEYADDGSSLTVQWYMHVNVTYQNGAGAPGAKIVIKDNLTDHVYSGSADDLGNCNWIPSSEYIENITGIIRVTTPHNVSAQITPYEGFAEPEPLIDYNKNVYIILGLDTYPPQPPNNLSFNVVGGTFVNLSWSRSSSHDVAQYNIYLNDTGTNSSFHQVGSTLNNYFNLSSLDQETTYFFVINAIDDVPYNSTNLSGQSTTLDITPPSTPFTLGINDIGFTYINLTWTPLPDPDVEGYQIFINDTGSDVIFKLLTNTNLTYFNVSSLNEDTEYFFRIKAYDEVPLFSGLSNKVSTSTLDKTPPLPPTSIDFLEVGGTFINITWTPSSSYDVMGYQVYLNDTGTNTSFTLIGNTSTNFYNLSGLTEETIYYFKLKAFDEVPLLSIFTNVTSNTTLDTQAPASPTLLTISDFGGSFIDLSWTASVSIDVEEYEIFINDTGTAASFHRLTTTKNTNYKHSGLPEEIAFYYKIRCYDEVPIYSTFSNVASATTLDLTAPGAPTGLSATPISKSQIQLTWTANPEPDISGYLIFINDTDNGPSGNFHHIQSTFGTSPTDTVQDLAEQVTYHFKIKAYDEVPYNSSFSIVISATTIDQTAPGAPFGLTATPKSDIQIDLGWTSNSETDLEGYKILMNDTNKGASGTYHIIHTIIGTSNSYSVTGLSEQITYHFKITAYDEVPNVSGYSNIASATTIDITSPSPPSGLSVTDPSINTLTISWNSNPETDIVGYFIYKSISLTQTFEIINTDPLSTTNYIDKNLDELTTYYYKLKAVDDADLESLYSDIVSGTTLLGPYAPEINNSLSDLSIAEDSYDDSTINLYHLFKDKNGDKLTFRIEGEDHIDISIFQDNGTVVLKPEHNWNGQETITFYASDSRDEISNDVTITVAYVNDPPDAPVIKAPGNLKQINDGANLDFSGKCDDPDKKYGDELTFWWLSNISGEIGVNDTLNNVVLPIGYHEITLMVIDGGGENSSAKVNVIVKETEFSDSDSDGMTNVWEKKHGLKPFDPSDMDKDPDSDGLSNLNEFINGTDPGDDDTDSDGLSDGDEVNKYLTKPGNNDTDNDGHDDGVDLYPLDSTRWEEVQVNKKSPTEEDNLMLILLAVIVVVIVILLLLFLFVFKKKKGGEGESVEDYRETPEMIPNLESGLEPRREKVVPSTMPTEPQEQLLGDSEIAPPPQIPITDATEPAPELPQTPQAGATEAPVEDASGEPPEEAYEPTTAEDGEYDEPSQMVILAKTPTIETGQRIEIPQVPMQQLQYPPQPQQPPQGMYYYPYPPQVPFIQQQAQFQQQSQPPAQQPRFCGECGGQIAVGKTFCGSCGQQVSD